MNTGIIVLLIILALWIYSRRSTAAATRVVRRKRGKKRGVFMERLAQQFINKDCLIYTLNSGSFGDGTIQGTIVEISENGMLIRDGAGQLQVLNLEYVTRIREFPRNKKGKKKSIITD